jgi:polyisoprenyl-teichoic acid--peptidoglycan teichoic acid transferase
LANPKGNGKKGWSTTKKVIVSISIIVGAALLIWGGVTMYNFASAVFNPAVAFKTPVPSPTPSPSPTPEPSATGASPVPTPSPTTDWEAQSDKGFIQAPVNILLLGIDSSYEREAKNPGTYRTDTMMLISLDFANNKVHMISIPRDTYTHIYNKEPPDDKAKINTAFVAGGGVEKHGFEYAMKTVSMLMGGITIDKYVGVKMNTVKDVTNALGGVDYNVDVEVNMNGRKILPGYQHLDGQQVLDYCRLRKGSSDIARVDRQQRMILAILDQLKTKGTIMEIPKVYVALKAGIYTNLTTEQVISLALYMSHFDMNNLARHTIPGNFLNFNKISYWGIRQDKLSQLVADIYGVDRPLDMDNDVNVIKSQIAAKQAAMNTAAACLDQGAALINACEGTSLLDPALKQTLMDKRAALDNAEALEDMTILPGAITDFKAVYDSANAAALAAVMPAANSAIARAGTAASPPLDAGVLNQINAARTVLQSAIAPAIAADIITKTNALSALLNTAGIP